MTYCVGILLDEGLLLAADTRTAAGVDHVASFQIHEAGNFIEVADEDACFGGMRRAFGDGIAALFDTIGSAAGSLIPRGAALTISAPGL